MYEVICQEDFIIEIQRDELHVEKLKDNVIKPQQCVALIHLKPKPLKNNFITGRV